MFQAKAAGRMLFEQVCKQLNLLETDYFGLEYMDSQGVTVSALLIYFKYLKLLCREIIDFLFTEGSKDQFGL